MTATTTQAPTQAPLPWNVLALMREAECVRALEPALAGGWCASAGEVVLVMVRSDIPGALGPTWYLTPKGHLWASPRWGSYRRPVQGHAARSLAVFDVMTHGAVLAAAARAGVAQGVLAQARELRASLAEALRVRGVGVPDLRVQAVTVHVEALP